MENEDFSDAEEYDYDGEEGDKEKKGEDAGEDVEEERNYISESTDEMPPPAKKRKTEDLS